jgi:hypothetical protein
MKKITYVKSLNFKAMMDRVSKLVDEGWYPVGQFATDGDSYIQIMRREEINELHIICEYYGEFNAKVADKIAEGYRLYGSPFPLDTHICQAFAK